MRILLFLCLVCLGVNFDALAQKDQCLISKARTYIGVRETPGRNNRGPVVDQFVLSVRGKLGQPWCGYFMMYVHQFCSCKMAGGMAMSWFVKQRLVFQPLYPGDLFSIWNPYLRRIGHVGLIQQILPGCRYIVTIEGNTNGTGGREGSGVCVLTRPVKQIYNFSRWWTESKQPAPNPKGALMHK